jgi:hypothetical protein
MTTSALISSSSFLHGWAQKDEFCHFCGGTLAW